MAQRSQVGTGSIFNAKSYNSDSLSMLNHSLNDNRVKVFNNLGGGYYMDLPSSNSDNKFATALMAAGVLAAGLGSIISATQSSGSTKTSDVTTSTTSDSSSSAALNDMTKLQCNLN